ncbi:MAG TPA: hypothetical protein VGH29_08010, partial [Candidatus Binataceae bacterium]
PCLGESLVQNAPVDPERSVEIERLSMRTEFGCGASALSEGAATRHCCGTKRNKTVRLRKSFFPQPAESEYPRNCPKATFSAPC